MRVGDRKAREYYMREAATRPLSVRQLIREIQSFAYDRVIANQIEVSEPVEAIPVDVTPSMLLKDPCVAEFLNLKENLRGKEKKVEKCILDSIEKFILELGKGFALVRRQFRVPSEDTEKRIDFVFFNIELNCYVLIDLKTTKITSRDIGQMDTYRRMFDALKRKEGQQPTIGILLSTNVDAVDVKFSIMSECEQMFAVKLLPFMPSKEELLLEIENARRRTANRKRKLALAK